MLREIEQGKYRFWCLREDPLLGSRLLEFERRRPVRKSQLNFRSLQQLPIANLLRRDYSIGGQTIRIRELGDGQNITGEKLTQEKLQLQWVWEGLTKSEITLSGNFSDNARKNRGVNITFP